MLPPLIEFQDVSFRYPDQENWIVRDVNMRIRPGEWIAIFGRNGSGKSTFAKLMTGLLVPTSGHVRIENKDTRDPLAKETIRSAVGLVFQNPEDQMVGMTVEEDISFGLRMMGMDAAKIGVRVHSVISEVGLAGLHDRSMRELSGGQKQLAAVAGILSMQPQTIVLDESTSMLSAYDAELLLNLIRRLHSNGAAIIHITHNPEDLWNANRIVVFHRNRIHYDGTASDLPRMAEAFYEAGLLPPFLMRMQDRLRQERDCFSLFCNSEQELTEVLWKYASKP